MGTATFQARTVVRIDGRAHLMLRKVDDHTWQLEDEKTKRITEKSDFELRQLYLSKSLTFDSDQPASPASRLKIGKPHREMPEPLLDDAKVKRQYVLAVLEGPSSLRFIEAAIQETWNRLGKPATPPHWSTVYRWKCEFIRAGRDIEGVVAKVARRGNRSRRYPEKVLEIAESAIDTVYLTRERKSIQDTVDKAVLEVKRENKLRPDSEQLPLPTRRLLWRLIQEIPAFDRCVAREGRTAALKRFRSVQRHRTTKAPLERCEIDHTPLDLMVLDDATGLPLGRPVLTVCLEDHTRCVLGFNIGFEPPSYLTVARCLKHAFLPKTNLKADYPGVVNEWLAHGVPREASVDNGQEFHSESLEHAAYSLGMELHYSPRKTPWHKGKVERFQKTLNVAIAHGAPGTTFSNIFEKDDYDPVKHAVVRLSMLKQIVVQWIVDVYHQKPHRSLKVPPAAAWASSIKPEDIPVPEDPERLDAILGRREERTLTHKGIELDGLLYNSPDLTKLRMQLGDKLKVAVCVDDGNIGSIFVLSPDKNRIIAAPALNQTYAAGLTAWQHKVCKRFAARELSKYDSTGWLEAKERIAELIRDEFALKKVRARSRIARYQESRTASAESPTVAIGPSPSLPAPATSPTPPPALTAPTAAASTPLSLSVTAGPRRFAPVMRPRQEVLPITQP